MAGGPDYHTFMSGLYTGMAFALALALFVSIVTRWLA